MYVQIAADCDWEPEHGLQLVYRGGNELVRVSEQDGHLTNDPGYFALRTLTKLKSATAR